LTIHTNAWQTQFATQYQAMQTHLATQYQAWQNQFATQYHPWQTRAVQRSLLSSGQGESRAQHIPLIVA
jgi:hypothetical protein